MHRLLSIFCPLGVALALGMGIEGDILQKMFAKIPPWNQNFKSKYIKIVEQVYQI